MSIDPQSQPLPADHYPAYSPGVFANIPPSRKISPAPRESAIIETVLLTGSDEIKIGMSVKLDCDFDRDEPILVDSINDVSFFTTVPNDGLGHGIYRFTTDQEKFWIAVAQKIVANLADWEVVYYRDKVRASVALTGSVEQ